MAAATITELSVEDFPTDLASGTRSRRARVFFRGPTGSAGKTISLASYVSGCADVEGIIYETDTNAFLATASAAAWTANVITIESTNLDGAYEGCYSVTFT